MQIPKEIAIGRVKYTVNISGAVPQLPGCRTGWIGYHTGDIHIATNGAISGIPYSAKQRAHVFWHEVVHGILHDMGEHRLNADEKFVDGIAKRLNQIVHTAVL